MKTTAALTIALAFALTACGDAPQEETQVPAEQTSAPTEEKGTSVSIGSDGIKVESDKVDVNISSDSGKVEVNTP